MKTAWGKRVVPGEQWEPLEPERKAVGHLRDAKHLKSTRDLICGLKTPVQNYLFSANNNTVSLSETPWRGLLCLIKGCWE